MLINENHKNRAYPKLNKALKTLFLIKTTRKKLGKNARIYSFFAIFKIWVPK